MSAVSPSKTLIHRVAFFDKGGQYLFAAAKMKVQSVGVRGSGR
jgi:hypothetical protein